MKDFPIPLVTESEKATLSAESTAKQWLENSAHTATAGDFEAHMNLISRKVAVLGIPDKDSIGYDDWARQCQHEFAEGVLETVEYRGLKMIGAKDKHIMFKTVEVLKPRDADAIEHGIEVVIEQEEDGVWRVVQERILSTRESNEDGLSLS